MAESDSNRPWWQRWWVLALGLVIGIALPILGRQFIVQCDHDRERLAAFDPNPQMPVAHVSDLSARDAANAIAAALGMKAIGMDLDDIAGKPLSGLEQQHESLSAIDLAAELSIATGLRFGEHLNLIYTGRFFSDRIGRDVPVTNGYSVSNGILAHLISDDEYNSAFQSDHLYFRLISFRFSVLDQGIVSVFSVNRDGVRELVPHELIHDVNNQIIVEISNASVPIDSVALEVKYQVQECFLTTEVSIFPDDFGCTFDLDALSAMVRSQRRGNDIAVEFSPLRGQSYDHGPVLWILDCYSLSEDGSHKEEFGSFRECSPGGSKLGFPNDQLAATDTLIIRVAFAEIRSRTLEVQLDDWHESALAK